MKMDSFELNLHQTCTKIAEMNTLNQQKFADFFVNGLVFHSPKNLHPLKRT